jgi:hypothetical protein
VRSQWESAPPEIRIAYGATYFDWFVTRTFQGITYMSSSPNDAIHEIVHATTARWPKTRYYAGLDSRLLGRWAVNLPDWIYDTFLGFVYNFRRPTPAALVLKSSL